MPACPRADDAAAFVLRMLDPTEADGFRHHLATCPACQLSVGELSDTAALLPLAVPPEQPPAHLREAIVARARRDRWHATTRPWWRLAAATVAGAAAVLFALQWWPSPQPETPPAQPPALSDSVPQPLTYAMGGSLAAPAATAQVVCTPTADGTRMTIVAEGLPPLAPGEVYQLWYHRSGQYVSVGVFVLDGAGRGGLATLLPGKPAFDALTVTREPDPYGLEPRGELMLGWSDVY